MERIRAGSAWFGALAVVFLSSSVVGESRFRLVEPDDGWSPPAVEAPGPAERRATGRGGAVLFVDDDALPGGDGLSWTTAFDSIEPALAAAGVGSEVRVAGGTYVPPVGGWNVPQTVSLVGGFAGLSNPGNPGLWDPELHETALTGDVDGDDGAGGPGAFVDNRDRIVWTFEGSTLRGVTVTAALSGSSGAVIVEDECLIELCRFEGNGLGGVEEGVDYVADQGPAMVLSGDLSEVRDCVFAGNASIDLIGGAICGGAMRIAGDRNLVIGCMFEGNRTLAGGLDNTNSGGAICVWRDLNRIVACDFQSNVAASTGGAVYARNTWIEIERSRFMRNRAVLGGAIATRDGAAIVEDSLLVANVADSDTAWSGGGAVFVGNFGSGPTTQVVRSVVYGNRAPRGLAGGIWSVFPDRPLVNDSVLWANEDRGGVNATSQLLAYWDPTAPSQRSNIIQGWPEVGPDTLALAVRGDDPMFVDPLGPDGVLGTDDDDFRVGFGSPCIDAGSGLEPGRSDDPEDLDLGGRPRVVDDPATPAFVTEVRAYGPVDIGAYEYQEDCDDSGVVDSVELDDGTLADVDANGVPDVCQPQTDCDESGTPDFIDIALGTAMDCNGNGVPDSCDIESGFSADLDGGGVPDECEPLTLFVDAGAPRSVDRAIAGTSWGTALADLQDALARARSRFAPTEIWVAAGTYTPNPVGVFGTDAFRVTPGIGLYGGFAGGETERAQRDPQANPTVLDADGAPHVLVLADADGAVVDGFTVTGGTGSTDGVFFFVFANDDDPGDDSDTTLVLTPDSFGGGMVVTGGEPLVRGCRFSGNTAKIGASAHLTRDAAPAFEGCEFEGEGLPELGSTTVLEAGGSFEGGDEVYQAWSPQAAVEATIDGCVFGDFNAVGPASVPTAAVAHAANSMIVRRSVFEGVSGPEWVVWSWLTLPGENLAFGPTGPIESVPRLLVDSCELVRNAPEEAVIGAEIRNARGPLDAGFEVYPVIEIVGTAIEGNQSEALQAVGVGGFPIDGLGLRPLVAATHCTIAGNERAYLNALWTAFRGCVIAANDSIVAPDRQSMMIDGFRYNLVEGEEFADDPPNVVGNLSSDPLFVDRLGPDGVPRTGDEDFRLRKGSPAIDSGDNDAVPAFLTHDLDGNPRIIDEPLTPDAGVPVGADAYVDRGAYEAGPFECVGDLDGDDDTDVFDFAMLADGFGAVGLQPFTGGDVNGDGAVDTFDFADLASDFGCGVD
jgi:hypothetical protein